MINYIYKDLNLSFIRHPSTSDVVSKYDLDAIKTAVRNILNTNKGEKLFNPLFGADLRKYLFELMTPSLKMLVRKQIKEEISFWEPRVNVDEVQISQTSGLGELRITLLFSLKNNPAITDSVSVVLTRVR